MFLSNITKKQHTRKDTTKIMVKPYNAGKNGNVYLLSKQSGKICLDQVQAVKFSLRKLLKKQAKA